MALTIGCDRCGADLERGFDLLRCARWREGCTFTRPIPEDVRMRAAGAPRLL